MVTAIPPALRSGRENMKSSTLARRPSIRVDVTAKKATDGVRYKEMRLSIGARTYSRFAFRSTALYGLPR